MLELISRDELRQQVNHWQQQQRVVALVPTMGNLHAGHLSLVQLARQQADVVVVSIFVNPTQFGAGEDFGNYPRTLDSDREQLIQAQCDALFMPGVEALYPFGSEEFTKVQAPASLANTLCGLNRPGHFDGVLSVVARLFNLIQPQLAIFGEKDFQQLLLIRRMVMDLGMPQKIIPARTVRVASGLAMSSRNHYLSDAARQQATLLQQTLHQVATQLQTGKRDITGLETAAMDSLREAGFDPDYVAIRDAETLATVSGSELPAALRILVAARLNGTRLIDNIACSIK